jgi:choice-of-anchor B domain-containing protein
MLSVFWPDLASSSCKELQMMTIKGRYALVVGASIAAAISMGHDHAKADPDGAKSRDILPPVPGPIYRNPDEWKLRGLRPPVPGGPRVDETFDSKNIILSSQIPLNNFPGYAAASAKRASDCWGYTSPSGREYALMALGWGLGIVEVTNPANPTILTVITGPNSTWRDVDVMGHYAYVVTDQSGVGIQIIDLSQVDAGIATLVRNFSQGGHTTTHTIVANPDSGFLYLSGGNAANTGMIPATTLGDPTFPTFTGPGWRDQYVHEVQVVTYTSGPYAGREIAFLFAAGPYYGPSYTRGLFIVDVTNKNNLVTLAGIDYPALRFCHQGWLSEDRRYLYINDELDGPTYGVSSGLKRVFDVTDLEHPRLVSTFDNGLTAVDHNEYVNGRYLYQANYTSGLRIWDLSHPLRPVEVAWIDTHPENNNPTYNGAWGNYPFFASGSILISDVQRGLFVVRLSLLEPSFVGEPPTSLQPGQPLSILAQVAQRNADKQTVDLMVRINNGQWSAYPMATTAGGQYEAQLPALSCYDRISYYIRATTSDLREFTWPLRGENDPIHATVRTSETVIFADDFEQNRGWTVQNVSLNSGAWERVTPLYNGGHGAVIGDADGSGMCFVTGNTFNVGVSGGPTRLISPIFDLSAHPEARITYWRWLLSIVGTTDNLITQISSNGGTNWTTVSSIGPATGGWEHVSFRIADYITPTAQVRVRFSISNADNSITEAGIDGFAILAPMCMPCYANCDSSYVQPILNVEDFSCFINQFAQAQSLPPAQQLAHYANCDQSTTPPVLNVEDFSCFINRFAAGCP